MISPTEAVGPIGVSVTNLSGRCEGGNVHEWESMSLVQHIASASCHAKHIFFISTVLLSLSIARCRQAFLISNTSLSSLSSTSLLPPTPLRCLNEIMQYIIVPFFRFLSSFIHLSTRKSKIPTSFMRAIRFVEHSYLFAAIARLFEVGKRQQLRHLKLSFKTSLSQEGKSMV